MQHIKAQLPTGTIKVSTIQLEPKLDALFSFAQRRNPKRSFLFVSKILGKHIPVSPSIMRQSYRTLANKIPMDLPEPIVFFGMAETAIGLGSGIFEEAITQYPNALFMISTRHELPNTDKFCEFKEEHSHATDHIIYKPNNITKQEQLLNAKTLILVDDEATTGKTFLNLYQGLVAAGLRDVEKLVTITLTNWSNKALSNCVNIPVEELSLINGHWEWQPEPCAPEVVMPSHIGKFQTGCKIATHYNFGREGIYKRPNIDSLFAHFFNQHRFTKQQTGQSTNPSVLVLGSSEFAYIPFLLAEELENFGYIVKFSATTRSPIALGLAIESALQFSDNYGEGVTHYCYNISHQHFDHIILCVETESCSIDDEFIHALKHCAQKVTVFSLFDG
ncbi:phosphoribosyltransferase domain-containing protein [Thorsellia anophelis]|uniref:TRSP domain C terminus to PRTase_2 n=1 Tax=Thorsellia anophelis DSM 18579 TaxID=1123402 RepID=A0A1I0EQI0_9GAMM|nr:phosphoribosyltransferase domain-containing protein [Thorsellia anophelis]SET46874.1 TRSP domain C terminus to PRTase_2 [Thorsellia anophelis DSM 18579]